ncbi:MAG: hypothetical protein M1834_005723 [Cirrosporium novae-zelandiae]|nr:MAG: hypothetical protein M1834_005723 [Cirrosporium novae-zelandiae]
MAGQNPSFVLHSVFNVKYEDKPVPEIKDPHEVIIRVKVTGICGSDVHYWTHGAIGDFVVKDPMVLGHESAGIVHAVGPAVKSLKVGDRVCMEPGVPCRRCKYCKDGFYNLCPDMAFAATPPYDGTLAKYYKLPEDFCYKLPDHVSLEEGALCEPLAIGVHITRQAAVKPGDSVVVFGCGPVGLLIMACAKAFGASKIIACDIQKHRLDFALKYAATSSFISSRDETPQQNAARLVKENNLGPGADVVVDATGVESCIQTSIHAVRNGGTYLQGGMGAADITFPIMAACCKELIIKGSFRYFSGDWPLAVDMLTTGRVSVKELITGKVSFEQAEEAFKTVKEGKGIKTLIEGPRD